MKIERHSVFSFYPISDKEKRNLAMLELVGKKGSISRTEISKITGINVVSVSNYINSYIEKNVISEKGLAVSSGGRKPELVALNAADNHVVGVEIGKASIRVAILDLALKIISKTSVPLEKLNMRETAAAIAGSVEEALKKAGVSKDVVKAVGIGIPDAAYVAVGASVEKGLDVPVFTGGRASCAAFGERTLNKEAAAENLLYMHSDLGRGIIITGDTCLGAAGPGGEIETNVKPSVVKSTAPLHEWLKYLEPWGELFGIIASAKSEVSKGVGTKIVSAMKGDLSKITEEAIIEAANQDDEVALNIIESMGINLGLRIAYLVNLFSPEVVVIGGGPEKAGDILFVPIKKMVKKLAFSQHVNDVKIVRGSLGEDAVSLGAASLAIREIFLKA